MKLFLKKKKKKIIKANHNLARMKTEHLELLTCFKINLLNSSTIGVQVGDTTNDSR